MNLRLDLYDSGEAWFDNLQLFQSPNLAPNPGFESDATSDYQLNDFVQVEDDAYTGRHSIYTVSNDPGDHKTASTLSGRLPVTGGKRLKTVIYTKYDNVTGTVPNSGTYVNTDFYDNSGAYLSSNESAPLTGTSDRWTLLKTEGMVPVDATEAVVTFGLRGEGETWFDHLHVFMEK
jgi:hypothetical protein